MKTVSEHLADRLNFAVDTFLPEIQSWNDIAQSRCATMKFLVEHVLGKQLQISHPASNIEMEIPSGFASAAKSAGCRVTSKNWRACLDV